MALRSRCLPGAPLTTLRAIVQAESNGNPNAMQIDFPKALLRQWHLPNGTLRLKRQPSTQREALDWLAYFQRYAIFVDLGLMQVSTAEAQRRGLPPSHCWNRVRTSGLVGRYWRTTIGLRRRPTARARRLFNTPSPATTPAIPNGASTTAIWPECSPPAARWKQMLRVPQNDDFRHRTRNSGGEQHSRPGIRENGRTQTIAVS